MNTAFRDANLISVEQEFRSVLAPASVGLDEVGLAYCFLRDAEDEAPRHDRAEPASGNIEDALIECIDGDISPTEVLLASRQDESDDSECKTNDAGFRKFEKELVRGSSAYNKLAAIVDDELNRRDWHPDVPHHGDDWVLLAMRQLNLSDSLGELEDQLKAIVERIARQEAAADQIDDPPPAELVSMSIDRDGTRVERNRGGRPKRSFKATTRAPKQFMRHKRTRQLGTIRTMEVQVVLDIAA